MVSVLPFPTVGWLMPLGTARRLINTSLQRAGAPACWRFSHQQTVRFQKSASEPSKLDALHTLRAVQLGFCGPGSGFTLIELPALVAMITILAWIRYDRHGKRSNYEYTDGHAARLSRAGARADQYLDHRVRFPLTNPPE